jgi:hypothetical protein
MTNEEFQAELTNRKNAIAAACVGATDEFLASAMSDGLTAEAASRKWQQQLAARAEEAEKKLAAVPTKTRGQKPLTTGVGGAGNSEAAGDFSELVKAAMEKNPRLTLREARHQVAKRHPGSHEAFVEACPAATRGTNSRE